MSVLTLVGGGYSQCRYQKSLIKSCVESNVKYDRVFFLSGLDYPLMSNKDIFDVLANNTDKEFIAGKNITLTEEVRQHKKIRQYHFFRDLPIKNPTLFRCVKGIAQLLMKYLPIRRTGYIVTRGKRCDIYYGSSWWCLSGACLAYVYNELFGNPDWENYFRFAYTPDELMIQTIVFNSKFKSKALLFPDSTRGLVNLTPLHYIEYHKSIKVFEVKDFEKLMSSGKMFARKLVTGKSDALMDKIDKLRTDKI